MACLFPIHFCELHCTAYGLFAQISDAGQAFLGMVEHIADSIYISPV